MAEEEEEVAKDQIADAETKGQILSLLLKNWNSTGINFKLHDLWHSFV